MQLAPAQHTLRALNRLSRANGVKRKTTPTSSLFNGTHPFIVALPRAGAALGSDLRRVSRLSWACRSERSFLAYDPCAVRGRSLCPQVLTLTMRVEAGQA